MLEQVLITSGAMTFLVLAATLVTATFLFSPTIEQIFGNIPQHFLICRERHFLYYHQTQIVILLVQIKISKCTPLIPPVTLSDQY